LYEAKVNLFFAMLMFTLIILYFPLVHDDEVYVTLLTFLIFVIGVLALFVPTLSWFAGSKAIRLLQNGTATRAKFFGVNLVGANRAKAPMVEFLYRVEDQAYSVFSEDSGASRLTIETCKDVFYDPMHPEQSVVLHGLPNGIHFDEQTGRFLCSPLRYMSMLLMATIVCGEIIAIAVQVVRAF
jgi:hypothetical protein